MITRRKWNARPPRSRDHTTPRVGYFHHTVTAQGKLRWTRAEERAHMRWLQNFHMDTNGWSDLGYNLVLFPSGRLYEARGFGILPAAQGGANSGTVACALVGNYEAQETTRRQRFTMRRIARSWKRKGVHSLGGHRDAPGQSTSCPGRFVSPVITRLAKRYKLRRV